VATELSREQLRRLARLGAEKRLEELRREEAAIRAAFPDLDGGGGRRRGGRRRGRGQAGTPTRAAASAGAGTGRKAKRRRRAPMSAAQKRAVSERMKKYWAARRKAEE
jgi:hypothetical protein